MSPPAGHGSRVTSHASRVTRHESRIASSELWTIIPVRGIAEGKSRLAGVLDTTARARLNRQLLEHTLRTVAGWHGELDHCTVVSACRETLAIAERLGAIPVDEGSETGGLNAAVKRGAAYAGGRGARTILVLPCDLPYLSAAALDAMVEAAVSERHLVIAPDQQGNGTNALLAVALEATDFRFGEGSCAAHVALAAERGWQVALCRHPELEFDLDTPADLAHWRKARGSGATPVI
jgi:2-phospho-L-lactate guanylyltransferase